MLPQNGDAQVLPGRDRHALRRRRGRTDSRNRSPLISSQNRVHRAHSTQRSRSSPISGDIGIGFGKVRLASIEPALAGPERQRLILQRALAARGRTRAVERVVEQQELEVRHLRLAHRSLVFCVVTTMPGATVTVHEVASLGWPSIWT